MPSFEQRICEAVAQTGSMECSEAGALIQQPQDTSNGNFTIPCFTLAKKLRKAPKTIAEEIAAKLTLPDGVSRAEPVNGYLNFYLDRARLLDSILSRIGSEGLNYGHHEPTGKTVVLDYSSPNIGKELAFHHIRSTMIGNCLSRVYAASGWKVVRINHLGDWGTQFGKLITMYLRSGKDTDDATLSGLTVQELNVLYAQFSKAAKEDPALEDEARAAFARLEEGDAFHRKLWTAFRDATLRELMRIYGIMGISFDHYTGESFFEDKMAPVVEELKERGLLVHSQDLDVVLLDDQGIDKPCLIRKSDGSSLYATRDLAAAIYRMQEYQFDRCLYVVDNGQSLHFRQVIATLHKMGREWSTRMVHIPFGLVLHMSSDGKWEKGKTRTGHSSLLRDVLDAAQEKILDYIRAKNPDLQNADVVAQQIGVSALAFNDLKNRRLMDIKFDWDTALSFEGATGPYVQNAHVRLCSIMAKAGYQTSMKEVDTSALLDDPAYELALALARKGDRIRMCMEAEEPYILAQYALELAEASHRFIHHCRVLGSPEERHRLYLVQCAQVVMEDVLNLLGIFPVRAM